MQVYEIDDLPSELDEEECAQINKESVESMEEIKLAYHLSRAAFKNKTNIAKKLKYEFLLWLAHTRDIKNAMKKTAPKKGKTLLVLFSGEINRKNAKLKENADPLRLEKISLSRI
jgi:tRNA threonylcarbamoyladenosine modification (KEOPS) complex Cgi121 subunit